MAGNSPSAANPSWSTPLAEIVCGLPQAAARAGLCAASITVEELASDCCQTAVTSPLAFVASCGYATTLCVPDTAATGTRATVAA